MLLSAMRTIFTVFGRAADELLQKLIALIAQLAMDADLRRVVAANGRLLGHDEEVFERCHRIELVLADAREHRVDLGRVEPDEGPPESQGCFLIERGQSAHPLQGQLVVALAQQEVDVVRDASVFRTGRSLVGGNDRFDQRLEGMEIRRRQHLRGGRSEEHTSELRSQSNLVCRLLLEKKKKNK